MKINKTFLVAAFSCLVLLASNSCQRSGNTASETQLDSVGMMRKAADERTLQDLRIKRENADKHAAAAKIGLERAEDIERDANDAAKQADRAYRTEEKAQRTRNEANEQAKKSDKANSKSQKN